MRVVVLVLTAVVVLAVVRAAVQAVALWLRVRGLRRTGERYQAEVVDTDVSRPMWNGGRSVRPVVRYRVDGRDHTCPLPNVSEKVPLGQTLTVAGRRGEPDDVVGIDVDESTSSLGRWLGILVLAAGWAAAMVAVFS